MISNNEKMIVMCGGWVRVWE